MATSRRPFSNKPLTIPVPPAPPAPQAPVNTLPANTSTPINSAKQFTTADGNAPKVQDNDSPAILVVLSCTLGYLQVIESDSVVISGNKTNKITLAGSPANINNLLNGLWYVPYLDVSGVDTVFFRTSDGTLIDTDSFTINVTGAAPPPPAPGPAPVNTVPGTQSLNTSLASSVTFVGVSAISVADSDSPTLTTTILCSTGVFKLNNLGSGATVLNNNTGGVQVTGTAAQIISALSGSQFFPPTGFTGVATLTVATTDGTSTDTDFISVVVTNNTAAPPPPGPTSAPFYPMGARLDLTNGKYPNGIVVNDRSQASLDADLKNRYLQWRAARVYNVPAINGAKAVKFTDADYPNTGNALTVSEGMGYGMLLAAFFEDQATFDGLLTLVRARPAYAIPAGFANANLYLMDWKLGPNGESSDSYGGGWNAMDGDLDIAQALLMADRQWKATGTTWNYKVEAQRTIGALKAWNFKADGTSKGLARPDISRTSDYMFGHFRSFADAMQDSFWTDTVIPRCIAINDRCQLTFSAANGGPAAIVPDFVVNTGGEFAGQAYTSSAVTNISDAFGVGSTYGSGTNNYVPSPGGRGDFVPTEMHYYANAQRCPQRWGNDLVYSGDASLKVQANRLINFIKASTGGNPANTQIGYRLNAGLQGPQGGSIGMGTVWPPRGMVAGFACGAQCDAAHQAYVNSCYTWLMNNFTVAYYDCELMLMSMVALAGNWWTVPGAPQTTSIVNNIPTAQMVTVSTPKEFNAANGNLVSLAYNGTKAVTAALTVTHGSMSMAHLQPGASGATFSRPAGSISIVDHGAVAGVGNNIRTAFQAAVAAAQATVEKTVWIPPGEWHFAGGVLRADGVKVKGAGFVNSVIYADDVLFAALWLEGNGPSIEQVTLTNDLTGRQDAWEECKVVARGAQNFIIKNNWIQNSPAASIQLAPTFNNQPPYAAHGYIGFNTIVHSMSDSIHCTDAASDVLIEHNDIDGDGVGDDGIACVTYSDSPGYVSFITARHNSVKNIGFGRGMSVVGGEDITYYNNYIENVAEAAGMYIAQEGSYPTRANRRIKFELNTVRNCGNAAIGHRAIMVYSDGTAGMDNPNDDLHLLRNDIIQTGAQASIDGIRYFGPQTNLKLEQNRYTGSGAAQVDDGGSTVTLNVAYSSGAIGYSVPTSSDPSASGTITNNDTANVSVNGTLEQVNYSLSQLIYTPDTAYSGADTLTIVSTDGTVSDTDVISITVGTAPPPPPPPPPEATGETVLQGYFSAGADGVWLDPTPIGNFQTLDSGGTDLTAYGNLYGRWKDRSGRNRHLLESDINARPSAMNDRLGPHSARYDPAVIAGPGGSTAKMYLCIVVEEYLNTYYGTMVSDWLGGNAGFRLHHNADESGQATWEGAPAPRGDIIFSVGNGTSRVEARGFSMGGAGGNLPGTAPPYTVFTGARAIECWIENGTANLRINKGNTITVPLGASAMAAGSSNIILGGWGTGSDDWNGLHEYQVAYLKNECPTAAERDLIVTWCGAKAGLSFNSPAVASIALWGDSLTNGYAGDVQTLYAGRTVYNGGVIGETSSQIEARFLADTGRRGWVTVIWAGHNDSDKVAALQNIADMVSALNTAGNTQFVIVANLPWANSQYIGGPERAAFDQFNTDMETTYPDNFLDIYGYLLTQGDGGANDNADIAAGLVPRSLRWPDDPIHLNDSGDALTAAYLKNFMDGKGW